MYLHSYGTGFRGFFFKITFFHIFFVKSTYFFPEKVSTAAAYSNKTFSSNCSRDIKSYDAINSIFILSFSEHILSSSSNFLLQIKKATFVISTTLGPILCFAISPRQQYQHHCVWRFNNFSITHILREIGFGDFRSAKSAF